MDKLDTMELDVAQQSTQSHLYSIGWNAGRVFKLKDSLNYNTGYGVFTGEWGFTEDYTLKFTDGSEYLWENCTLVEKADPEVAWFINLELDRIQKQHEEFINTIKEKYNKIYKKAIGEYEL
jgi:hypothetical protein